MGESDDGYLDVRQISTVTPSTSCVSTENSPLLSEGTPDQLKQIDDIDQTSPMKSTLSWGKKLAFGLGTLKEMKKKSSTNKPQQIDFYTPS